MLTRNFSLSQQFVLSPYIGASYYSSKYTDYYFGIKEAELGGKITSAYKAKERMPQMSVLTPIMPSPIILA